MRLTVLGNAGRYLAPLAGGSSYLVEHEGKRVLLDAGQGAREALAALGVARLDAVWVSHFHFDHCLDLPTLRGLIDASTPILVPRGERARLDALAQAYVWKGAWELGSVREVDEGDEPEVAGLRWRFARTRHSAPSLGLRLEADGAALAYASDSAPCAPLAALARDADLLLMHTLLPDVEPDAKHARIHATARTAGALAAEAGARALALSHRYWGSRDEDMLREARASFAAARLARDGEVVDVSRSGSGTP